MTHNEAVSSYIRDYRRRARQEMRDFEEEPDPPAAIGRAARCELRDGTRHPHQRRIPKELLRRAETRLQGIQPKLATAADFAALHRLVDKKIGGIKGVGALMVYDIAHRIGAYFKKAPELVYLHAGTRIGARALGITGDSVDPKQLPKAFSRLSPAEIEDCLCIYKDELRGIAHHSHQPGCSVARRQRKCCM